MTQLFKPFIPLVMRVYVRASSNNSYRTIIIIVLMLLISVTSHNILEHNMFYFCPITTFIGHSKSKNLV